MKRLAAFHRWVPAHLGLTFFGLALLLAGALALFRATPREQDIGLLLPGGPGSPREVARLLSEFGVLDTLLVDLELPGASRDTLGAIGETLAERLRKTPYVKDVYTGPTLGDLMALGRVLLPRRLYLLPDPAGEIERRLASDALASRLAELKLQLASPQALAQKDELLGDPLGLSASLLKDFSGMAGAVDSYRGQLLSRDGKHLLLVVTPSRSGLDARASAELLGWLRQETARLGSGAVLRAVGGPRFSSEAAGALRHDVALTLLTSALGLMALFLARFRSLRLLLIAQLPLVFGMAGGLLAVAAVHGRINVITFAFGAVMIGVGIDYPIYLLNAAAAQPEAARLETALGQSWRPLWRGFVTTFLGFAVMLLSPLPGLRELALFGGAGIATAFAVTLTVLVPLAARWGPTRWPGIPAWMRAVKGRPLPGPLAWALALGLLGFAGVRWSSLQFDGELRHLDAQRPEVLDEYQEVMARFGLAGSGSLVVARGHDAEEALELNDAVAAALKKGPASAVRGLSTFLPSRATQAARARTLANLDLTRAQGQLREGALRAGFSPGAFDAFWEEVSQVRSGRRPPLLPDDLRGTSLEPLVRRLLRCTNAGCLAVTALSLPPGGADVVTRSLPAGAALLDGDSLAAKLVAQLPRQLAFLTGVGLLVNLAVLAVSYRSFKDAVLACLPCLLGLCGTLGILSALAVPLNVVSAGALVLVLGCGVDYGIFALQEVSEGRAPAAVESTGVLLASLSTLLGFGTLTLAVHPALHTLGTAVGLGVAISALAALFLLPALAGARRVPS